MIASLEKEIYGAMLESISTKFAITTLPEYFNWYKNSMQLLAGR